MTIIAIAAAATDATAAAVTGPRRGRPQFGLPDLACPNEAMGIRHGEFGRRTFFNSLTGSYSAT